VLEHDIHSGLGLAVQCGCRMGVRRVRQLMGSCRLCYVGGGLYIPVVAVAAMFRWLLLCDCLLALSKTPDLASEQKSEDMRGWRASRRTSTDRGRLGGWRRWWRWRGGLGL
jgi:hypothetical protein